MATYYRVPMKLDGRCSRSHRFELVGGELLTEKECSKEGLNPEHLEKVEISSKKTYWFFGARFELE